MQTLAARGVTGFTGMFKVYEEKSPLQRLQEKDKKRAVNYRHYTAREWGDSHNYHLCLDSGVLGEETCVALIKALAEK